MRINRSGREGVEGDGMRDKVKLDNDKGEEEGTVGEEDGFE